MSDHRISLNSLEADRNGWGTNWRPVIVSDDDERYWHGQFSHEENEHVEDGYITCNSDKMDYAPELGQLIADEHNAIPVLIEVARAALAWSKTKHNPRGHKQAETDEYALLDVLRKVAE